ncbi:hypothetical protein [Sphingobium subterraneum]|uniref:Epoxyqueuosine reductase QueG n=1 Tax=Sphingobium subterraneum TaxID=627688 RepID=A0A841J0X1_9SPHN|nr:hypothetical protein [Sphingobium subterraneum]MBB6122325.1 epoxyqueuosine reductase QueG [Sphingobium subterraneum]
MKIFPRPVSPKSAASDLWTYLVERRAHKWPVLALSATLTGIIVWAFVVDANINTMPRQNQIIYFQTWSQQRRESEIIEQQKRDLARYEQALRGKQKEMQKIADTFGIDWRKDEQRNAARRAEALRQINAMLDARLAKAKAKEQAEGLTGASPAPISAGMAEQEEAAKAGIRLPSSFTGAGEH